MARSADGAISRPSAERSIHQRRMGASVNKTLSDLVRKQILAEGPDIASMKGYAMYANRREYDTACVDYVDEQLNALTNVELLERISDALQEWVAA
jgi:hypothetical protein